MTHPPIHYTVLDNGITVIAVENQAADIITARCFFRAGGCWENLDQAGVFHLIATTLTKGTTQRDAVEIAETVESVGASLGADASADYFILSLKTVSADFTEILTLAAEILRSPAFPPDQVYMEQQQTLQNIRAQLERPFNLAFFQLREAMYSNHPYQTSILGTPDTVPQLTSEILHQYHQTYFRPDNLIISISGRIPTNEAVDRVQKSFGDWKSPSSPLPTLQLPTIDSQPCDRITSHNSQQSIIMLGYFAPTIHKQEDYIILKLLNTYLGNGLSSRLFVELREKRGLAYDVSAFYPTRIEPSQFVAYIGTAPDNTTIAQEGLQAELQRLCEVQLTPEELQAAKNKLIGQYALGKQTNAEIAQMLGWYETIGVGIDFDLAFPQLVSQVTPDQIQTVASRYFSGDPYLSVVGP